MQVPFGFNTTEYSLIRKTSRLYEGFIPVTTTLDRSFDSGFIEVSLDQVRSLSVTLTGSTVSVLTFTDETVKKTDVEFTSLTGITTSIGAAQGGLAATLFDVAGRPIESEQTLETKKGAFSYRSRPVGFFNQGVVVQSEAVVLKAKGERPQENDLVFVAGTTFSVVKADEIVDVANDSFYRCDLRRLGRER